MRPEKKDTIFREGIFQFTIKSNHSIRFLKMNFGFEYFQCSSLNTKMSYNARYIKRYYKTIIPLDTKTAKWI